MRQKIDIIHDCDDCSHVWFYLGVDPCCLLKDKKRIDYKKLEEENEGIPDWCPLQDVEKGTAL